MQSHSTLWEVHLLCDEQALCVCSPCFTIRLCKANRPFLHGIRMMLCNEQPLCGTPCMTLCPTPQPLPSPIYPLAPLTCSMSRARDGSSSPAPARDAQRPIHCPDIRQHQGRRQLGPHPPLEVSPHLPHETAALLDTAHRPLEGVQHGPPPLLISPILLSLINLPRLHTGMQKMMARRRGSCAVRTRPPEALSGPPDAIGDGGHGPL
jgi:hypothetical protein